MQMLAVLGCDVFREIAEGEYPFVPDIQIPIRIIGGEVLAGGGQDAVAGEYDSCGPGFAGLTEAQRTLKILGTYYSTHAHLESTPNRA